MAKFQVIIGYKKSKGLMSFVFEADSKSMAEEKAIGVLQSQDSNWIVCAIELCDRCEVNPCKCTINPDQQARKIGENE